MDYFAGLDVSVKETSVCIVDDAGKIVREVRVASEPPFVAHRADFGWLRRRPELRLKRTYCGHYQSGARDPEPT
jgi:hypothetical protein